MSLLPSFLPLVALLAILLVSAWSGEGGLRYASAANESSTEENPAALEKQLKQNPENGTVLLKLAKAYHRGKKDSKALELYIQRMKLAGDEEEMYVAAYSLAWIMHNSYIRKEDWSKKGSVGAVVKEYLSSWATILWGPDPLEDVLNAYMAAIQILPYRQEPYYSLASLYRLEHQDWYRCAAYAKMGLAQGLLKPSSLDPVLAIYEFSMLEELCVCSYYVTKYYQDGYHACKTLQSRIEKAMQQNPPPSEHELDPGLLDRTKANIKAYMGRVDLLESGGVE